MTGFARALRNGVCREATKLARLGGVSADQKYVVVVPEANATERSSTNR